MRSCTQRSSFFGILWWCGITNAGLGIGYSEFKKGPKAPNSFQVERRTAPVSPDLSAIFNSSSWIWTADANVANAPEGDRAFRYTFTSPPGKLVGFADILITVDNNFSLYVNGDLVGESDHGWKKSQSYHISFRSNVTRIVFAIRATNYDASGSTPSAAGLIAGIKISFDTGDMAVVSTDSTWLSNNSVPGGFELPSFDDRTWPPAKELTKYGGGIWKNSVKFPVDQSNITIPFSPTTSSPVGPILTVTPAPTPSHGAAQHVGAIVGGTLGGVTFVLLIILACIWRRRKFNKQLKTAKSIYHPLYDGHMGNTSIRYTSQNLAISAYHIRRHLTDIPSSKSMPAVIHRNQQLNATQWTESNTGINTRRVEEISEEPASTINPITSSGGNPIEIVQLPGNRSDGVALGAGKRSLFVVRNASSYSGSETSTYVNP